MAASNKNCTVSVPNAPRPRIAIYVEGGVLATVMCDCPDAKVVLVDRDDLNAEGKTDNQIGAIWKRATKNLYDVY